MSDYERVKDGASLKAYAEDKLEKARGGYICPECGSGTGPKKTPAFSITPDGKRWKCFSCGTGGDVFDLAGIINGTDDKAEQLQIVASWAGIAIEGAARDTTMYWDDPIGCKGSGAKEERARRRAEREAERRAQMPDYTVGRQAERERIKAAQEAIKTHQEAVAYLEGRGFTRDEIERFQFGYDVEKKRVVIPWRGCDYYHIDRAIDGREPKYTKPKTEVVGPQPVDNPDTIEESHVFIVEGMLDALAVEAVGQPAVGLAGTAYRAVLESLASRGYRGVVVLMLDADKDGRAAQEKAAAMAEELHLLHLEVDAEESLGAKDAAAALAANRELVRIALESIALQAEGLAEARAEEAEREAREALMVQDPTEIAAELLACRGMSDPISTGFSSLDLVMNGGIRPGLMVLGAVSSAGKTTLIVQMADHMAAAGYPVLFVTIEQSGREIVAKSLSRMMAQSGFKSVGLWDMSWRKNRETWSEAKNRALFDAVEEYSVAIAPNLRIMAANEQPGVGNIRAAAERMADERGRAPVVFIDYLQLLRSKDERSTDKQAADFNVSMLRRMARDMEAPVVVVSSLNRTSYSGAIEMESFKESGGIEYGADVLLGLQPRNMEQRLDDVKGEDARKKAAKDITKAFRRSTERKSELVVLKNRNGAIPPAPLPLTFYAASSLFEED